MADRKRALITGITGQDGSYLAELLLAKGYEVHGLARRAGARAHAGLGVLSRAFDMGGDRLQLHMGDLADGSSLEAVVRAVAPDEIYHLAAQSHVGVSFELPEHTGEVTGLGTLRILEAIRKSGLQSRFYQASTSELFGKVAETPQRETTPLNPRSPYACAKAYGYYITKNYREAYEMFAVNGILFNHESERRGEGFVTRKITRAVGRIKAGLQDELVLGNLEARRDWGHAEDYVEAMWRMLQAETPEDFVIGSGETHSVREFVELAFDRAGLDWRTHVRSDAAFMRPSEVDLLLADPSKAEHTLGWRRRVRFEDLVARMVDHDVALAGAERADGTPAERRAAAGAGPTQGAAPAS